MLVRIDALAMTYSSDDPLLTDLVWSRQSSRYILLDAGNSLNLVTVLRSSPDAMVQSFQYLAVSQSTSKSLLTSFILLSLSFGAAHILTGICTLLLLQALTSLSDHKPAK
jgi:hypothetical protein